jgi:hypothetical protein
VDLAVVDRLARLRLRAGVRVVRASPELWALIDLCGLRETLGQAEPREERLRVEEERQLCDLPVHDLDHL